MNAAQAPAARVRHFFEVELPAVIAARAELFSASRGSISVHVQDAGAWTLVFGDPRAAAALQAEARLDTDLVVICSAPLFADVLAGGRDLAGTRPVALGDTRLLERLGMLLLPTARGGLGARLWGS